MLWQGDNQTLVSAALWVSLLCYLIGFIPQIIMNYRLKSLHGLSDVYLFLLFKGYTLELFYVYCLSLPTPYRIIIPLCFFALLIIVFQRFYYMRHDPFTNRLALLYLGTVGVACLLIPLAIKYTYVVGHATGWVCTIIWCTYQTPQLIKIFVRRTVSGFSFGLATLAGLAALIEFITGLFVGLPYQTMLAAVRGIIVYLLFCLQFWVFAR